MTILKASTPSIITNSKVGNQMSALEAAARRGDPEAQRQLWLNSMAFAESMAIDTLSGADMQDRKDMLR